MAPTPETRPRMMLEPLQARSNHTFSTPTKRIHDGDDLSFFLSSTAYRDLTIWLMQLNRSMFPTSMSDGGFEACILTSPPVLSAAVNSLRSMLDALTSLFDQAPPSTGPRRFGNVAFRVWHRLAEGQADDLLRTHLSPLLQACEKDNNPSEMIEELKAYFLGSFGSAQRLDYGTGHELSFLAFLGCLWKLNVFAEGEERSIVTGIIQPYLVLIRRLILIYTLEPAGSHGVWGLDDHSFAPYIFGSAQLGPPIDSKDYGKPVPTEGSLSTAPSPAAVANKARTLDYKDDNMYFSAIQFIYDVKRGPFWEHSPILYDISGLKDGWAKINKGMLKMYAAEVLGKFPVVQHFPFGSMFCWEMDPRAAITNGGSIHAQQQPQAMVSKDVPVPQPGVGTSAPWASAKPAGSRTSVPQMQATTGVPTTRAPWAASGDRGHGATRGEGLVGTAAPWSTQRPSAPPGSTATAATTAPWAKINPPM
ncbi:Serine/threonine-protein phosphatase 2A activator 1 [Elasticomyces elasticus]|nr:Serine/threonine-protein phosphatase 2A activator 1 [Elasticomyces elasticus]KAK3663472.1 Serine/threonine-protein phosphatase 2A activator 1 [Elasticomyces elasticus]KAK4927143.1 Serine/threonine-protein phosphatase 2A activator 1 [Elasticomyces elasticus]KAK5768993.1 Serine/threonine-protein phosphatase 2A activator 1 [Elasticomyces elasticus]